MYAEWPDPYFCKVSKENERTPAEFSIFYILFEYFGFWGQSVTVRLFQPGASYS